MNANYDAHPEIGELYDHIPVYRDRKDVAFYVDLCRAAKGEVLELGCGTGRILIPAAEAGCTITGLDQSGVMLERCRERSLSLLIVVGEPLHPLGGRKHEQSDQDDDDEKDKEQNGKCHVPPSYTEHMKYCYADTPIGSLLIAGDEEAIHLIAFPKNGKPQRPEAGWTESTSGPRAEAVRQLREYFSGRRQDFDLPLALQGTDFQRKVWRKLQEIPYGETISYGELAKRVGSPKASRAVGSANGKNRIPIVIPCHRVIAGDGGLGGFGGGLTTKEKLLAIEGKKLALAQSTR